MNTDEIDTDDRGLLWDKPHFYLNGKIFVPNIYEVKELNEKVPQGYNTVSISLDGQVSSDLNWKAAEEAAQHYRDQGFMLFWNLDLGLFDRLKSPISNQTQFLSLMLSLEHLRDTLWKKFEDHTLGVCLYQGPTNFLGHLLWDDHMQNNYLSWGQQKLGNNFEESHLSLKSLFSRDVAAEYLTMIANRMPDAMQLFMNVNIEPSISLTLEAQLLHRERYDRLHLNIRNGRLPTLSTYDQSMVGVCLPDYKVIDPQSYEGLEPFLENLLNKKISFRIIPEAFLINEWDGLNTLVVMPSCLSTQGKRKLQGFEAAGGTVLALADAMNLR